MKVEIDKTLTGKALFSFLIENKEAIINQKKALKRYSDPFEANVELLQITKTGIKAEGDGLDLDPQSLRVKTVANTAYWCDSQMDVLLPDAAKRSIQQRSKQIYHLHDHQHEVSAIVGDLQEITLPSYKWKDLNVDFPGNTQVILFDTIIREYYNKQVFNLYKAEAINQHSIGLQYLDLKMAINDDEYKEEYALWKKHIDKIANKEVVERRGFFFVVSEFRLLENSAVLWGANEITPTIETTLSEQSKHSSLVTLVEAPAPVDTVKFGFSSLSKII